MNITDFTLDVSALRFVGKGLNQPESVLAEKDGTLWISDKEGTVTRMDKDGFQTRLGNMGGEPNGLAMDREGNLYVANLADGTLYKVGRDGSHEPILSEINGEPLGAANFPWIDSQGRIWLSVTTRRQPWFLAAAMPKPDGYIILIDEKGPRIVADRIMAANEVRLDPAERFLYVSETMGRRILRFPVNADGSLGDRQSFGPDPLGFAAYPDGLTFDTQGNLWVPLVMRNELIILTADGAKHVVFSDVKEEAVANVVEKIDAGELTPEDFFACAGETVQFPSSVTFAGPDLRTVYMGSLVAPQLITFQSPVAGVPMHHWDR